MEGSTAPTHAAVDGRCPRCGTYVSATSQFCRECLLQLMPGDDEAAGRTALLRQAWEREHPEAVQAYEAWAAAPAGPPPGLSMPADDFERAQHPVTGEWKPLDARLKRVKWVLGVVIVLALVNAISNAAENSLLERIQAGEAVSDQEISSNDTRVGLLSLVQLLLLITAAVVFIQWFHRAYQNVDALRTGVRRHGTGWAIGGWFVPIMFLFRPKQIANDLWASGAAEDETADRSPPFFMLAWWTLWVISAYLSNFAARNLFDDDVASLIKANKYYIASDLLSVVGGILAIVVAVRITQRLQARHAEQEQRPAPVPFSPQAPGAAPPA